MDMRNTIIRGGGGGRTLIPILINWGEEEIMHFDWSTLDIFSEEAGAPEFTPLDAQSVYDWCERISNGEEIIFQYNIGFPDHVACMGTVVNLGFTTPYSVMKVYRGEGENMEMSYGLTFMASSDMGEALDMRVCIMAHPNGVVETRIMQ